MTAYLNPAVRHEAVLLFDVTDGNPNGDPDAENRPRTDAETGHGLVTDVCLKRKIRDTIGFVAEDMGLDAARFQIFVQAGRALATRGNEAYGASGITLDAKKLTDDQYRAAQGWLAGRYVDIRMFGAVLSVGRTKALGQIRGPFQLGMARSIDPIHTEHHTITRVTQVRQDDIDKGETTEIGKKWTVPYGLYRVEIHYTPPFGVRTGVTPEDLDAFWRTVEIMFDLDKTATRGVMRTLGLWVFSHRSAIGVAPVFKTLGRVRVESSTTTPRTYRDYSVQTGEIPDGVQMTTLVDIWSES